MGATNSKIDEEWLTVGSAEVKEAKSREMAARQALSASHSYSNSAKDFVESIREAGVALVVFAVEEGSRRLNSDAASSGQHGPGRTGSVLQSQQTTASLPLLPLLCGPSSSSLWDSNLQLSCQSRSSRADKWPPYASLSRAASECSTSPSKNRALESARATCPDGKSPPVGAGGLQAQRRFDLGRKLTSASAPPFASPLSPPPGGSKARIYPDIQPPSPPPTSPPPVASQRQPQEEAQEAGALSTRDAPGQLALPSAARDETAWAAGGPGRQVEQDPASCASGALALPPGKGAGDLESLACFINATMAACANAVSQHIHVASGGPSVAAARISVAAAGSKAGALRKAMTGGGKPSDFWLKVATRAAKIGERGDSVLPGGKNGARGTAAVPEDGPLCRLIRQGMDLEQRQVLLWKEKLVVQKQLQGKQRRLETLHSKKDGNPDAVFAAQADVTDVRKRVARVEQQIGAAAGELRKLLDASLYPFLLNLLASHRGLWDSLAHLQDEQLAALSSSNLSSQDAFHGWTGGRTSEGHIRSSTGLLAAVLGWQAAFSELLLREEVLVGALLAWLDPPRDDSCHGVRGGSGGGVGGGGCPLPAGALCRRWFLKLQRPARAEGAAGVHMAFGAASKWVLQVGEMQRGHLKLGRQVVALAGVHAKAAAKVMALQHLKDACDSQLRAHKVAGSTDYQFIEGAQGEAAALLKSLRTEWAKLEVVQAQLAGELEEFGRQGAQLHTRCNAALERDFAGICRALRSFGQLSASSYEKLHAGVAEKRC